MKAAELTDTRRLEVREQEQPTPDDDEVLVAVSACGVCMTDYHMYSGGFTVDFPIVPGHESAGEIAETGGEVTRYDVGDRVAIIPSIPCAECRYCKSGRENLCTDLTSIGGAAKNVINGAFAEYVSVPARSVESIGDIDYRTAAFAEPLGCCVNGVDQIDVESGETVVVIGAGPIGLLLVQLLRNTGAGRIVVSELVEERREVALDVGADHVIDPSETDPFEAIPDLVGDVDVAVEAVGTPKTIEQAHELTGPGGRTLVFGVPPEDATIELSPFDIFYEEREIIGTYALTPDSFARAVTLLESGRIDVDPLVTDEYDLDGLQDAFDQMEETDGLKKVIYPGGRD